MKKILLIITVLLIIFPLVSCKKKNVTEEISFGIGEVYVTKDSTIEDIDKRIELIKNLGVKSTRFWLRVGKANNSSNEALFRLEDGLLTLNNEYYNKCIHAIDKLIESGITHIVLNPCWMYQLNIDNTYSYSGGNTPSLNTKEYMKYMEGIYIIHRKIESLFPKIKYFELGNEMNYGFLSIDGNDLVSSLDKANVVLDYSYYATKGIKENDKENKTILNGLAEVEYVYSDFSNSYNEFNNGVDSITSFLELLYSGIESNNYPSISTTKSNKIEDYFDVIAIHPYSIIDPEDFKFYMDKVHNISVIHNDKNREIYITEYGLTKTDSNAGYKYLEILSSVKEIPYIKTIHFFILSDTSWCNDEDIYHKTYCLIYKVDDDYQKSDCYKILEENIKNGK